MKTISYKKVRTINDSTKKEFEYISFGRDTFTFRIDDSSLSRIIHHTENGMMILSASRSNLSDEENLNRSKELERLIRNAGLGFISSVGYYKEDISTTGNEEISYVVPYNKNIMTEDEFLKFGIDIAKKFNQDSILVELPSINDGNPTYVKQDGSFDTDLKFNKKIKTTKPEVGGWTELKKGDRRAFSFTQDNQTITLLGSRRVPVSTYSANVLAKSGEINED